MTPMTDLPLLREAVTKMTPGPWRNIGDTFVGLDNACMGFVCGGTDLQDMTIADINGLVALRNAAPALLDEVEDMQRQRDQWKEFAYTHPEVTPPVVTQEIAALRLDLASSRAQRDTAWRDIERLRSELDRAHRLGAGYGSDGEVPPWMK